MISILRCVMVAALGLALAQGAALAGDNSGFLKDYSKLKKDKDAHGVNRLLWVNPNLNKANYQKLLLDPVVFYPEPKPDKQVSDEALDDIRSYLDEALKRVFGAEVPLVDQPGPGVARVRLAITAVAIKKGLKPWELVPTAMVLAGAKEATGRRKHPVDLFVEAEISDSVSNEVLVMSVREAKGIEMSGGDEQLTLEMAKPQIDAWGEALRQEILNRLKK